MWPTILVSHSFLQDVSNIGDMATDFFACQETLKEIINPANDQIKMTGWQLSGTALQLILLPLPDYYITDTFRKDSLLHKTLLTSHRKYNCKVVAKVMLTGSYDLTTKQAFLLLGSNSNLR